MDHNYITKNEVTERYITGSLNDEDVLDFEEHLLFCDECRTHVAEMEVVIKTIQSKPAVINKPVSKTETYYKYFLMAASLLLLVTFSWLIINNSVFNNKLVELKNTLQLMKDTVMIQKDINKELSGKLANHTDNSDINKPVLIAQNFSSNKDLERLIGEEVRSEDFNMKISTLKSSLSVKWTSSESITLVIYNNKRKSVLTLKDAKSPAMISQKLDNGKYYLALQSGDGVIKQVVSFLCIDNQFVY